MQIQSAWQDGLWANIINMAKSKAKQSKDPYFEVSCICFPLPPALSANVIGNTLWMIFWLF